MGGVEDLPISHDKLSYTIGVKPKQQPQHQELAVTRHFNVAFMFFNQISILQILYFQLSYLNNS